MIDVEKQLARIIQQNPPAEVASSIVTAKNLANQYGEKYYEIRNKMAKDASIGLVYFALAAAPIIASIISGEIIYLVGCVPTVIPLVFGLRKINYIRRNIPGLFYNLDMFIDMNETAQFLIKTQKPK